ncbi:hypothetical protein HYDPIDRAFT_176901 [Hydnomerulius pinastri MD-312]|uniref:Protein-S-isoprenylcysteine O-methyltransferase n=1 Tax=Hydnomerulius pinastri MD-312 TaxID=994086 RepID=A0A0C9V7X9_9AGAM|nr:hypothetical protein HYDPIDRAFT_176901 [Hydnomerulius pinastri MD-312]
MSLIKVPFVLGAAVGFQVSSTPPAAAAVSDEERVKSEAAISAFFRIASTLRIVYWLLSVLEVASAISTYVPSSVVPSALSGAFSAIRSMDTPPTGISLLGAALVGISGILRVQCYRALGRLFTFHLSIRKDHRLVTDGPYAVVRHPSYSAMLMCLAGVFLAQWTNGSWLRVSGVLDIPGALVVLGGWWVILVSGILGVVARAPEEDRMMKSTFGEEWDGWSARVKYLLIPFIY